LTTKNTKTNGNFPEKQYAESETTTFVGFVIFVVIATMQKE